MRLRDRFAVITGGASGIGAATARLFATEGARVAILDRDQQAAESVAEEIRGSGGRAGAFLCDVSDEPAVRQAVDDAAALHGPITVLFNNAGIAIRRSVAELDVRDWDQVIAVNLRGAFLCSKHCLRHFHDQGGSIIHASSVTGITGVRGRAAYSAAKGALAALTRNMALDLAPRGIRVNCVCPGYVETAMQERELAWEAQLRATSVHDVRRGYIDDTPLGRLQTPADVAAAIAFLASERAGAITGEALSVNGGSYMD